VIDLVDLEKNNKKKRYWAAPTEETCVSPEAPLAAQQLNHQLT
jgi:hypothetical protein